MYKDKNSSNARFEDHFLNLRYIVGPHSQHFILIYTLNLVSYTIMIIDDIYRIDYRIQIINALNTPNKYLFQ